jgi:hypothetical protein
VRVVVALLLLSLVGCPERWDPNHPPGVSHGGPRHSTAGNEDTADTPAREPPPVLQAGDQIHRGEIADGDHVLEVDGTLYDELAFSTVEGASIVITMQSTAFDPYLHLIGPDGRQVAHGGTPPDEPTDVAELVVIAPATGDYRIYANALEPAMRGPYELRLVVETPPRPRSSAP